MSTSFPMTATMSCPVCGRPVEPAADSTWIVAWVQLSALRPRVVRTHSKWTAGHVFDRRGLRPQQDLDEVIPCYE